MTFSDRAVEAAKKAAPKFWRQTSDFDKHMAKCLTAEHRREWCPAIGDGLISGRTVRRL